MPMICSETPSDDDDLETDILVNEMDDPSSEVEFLLRSSYHERYIGINQVIIYQAIATSP